MLEAAIGLGVAGNFTGHLEEAGEASDFVGVEVADPKAPKGVFPFYVPGADGLLGTYPVSSTRLQLPEGGGNVQIEPEVGLIADLEWADDGLRRLIPRFFTAYDDCSIRRPGAKKISEKKNWGPATKGLAEHWLPIDRFGRDGAIAGYRLASFLVRDGELHEYGLDSPVAGYSYFGDRLVAWLVDRLDRQEDAGPLERIADHLETAGRPERAIIGIGATRYTEYGQTHFLEPGDHAIVAVYQAERWGPRLHAHLREGGGSADGLAVLRQVVYG